LVGCGRFLPAGYLPRQTFNGKSGALFFVVKRWLAAKWRLRGIPSGLACWLGGVALEIYLQETDLSLVTSTPTNLWPFARTLIGFWFYKEVAPPALFKGANPAK
jgi:hypothetical protein